MWVGVILLMAVVEVRSNFEYNNYYDQAPDENAGRDLYEFYGEMHTEVTPMIDTTSIRFTRIRRFGERISSSTTPVDLRYIKGALKEILAGHELDGVNDEPADIIELNEDEELTTARTNMLTSTLSTETYTFPPFEWTTFDDYRRQGENGTMPTDHSFDYTSPTDDYPLESETPSPSDTTVTTDRLTSKYRTDWTFSDPLTQSTTKKTRYTGPTRPRPKLNLTGDNLDINAILGILANLTYDYEWNLTEEFNRTLIESGVPKCPTPSEPTTTATTPAIYDFSRSPVVSKCFVCGLTTTEIPRSAHCADAFGGDFLPLAPVDARSRSHIASFRKYCRRMDVHNFVVNPSEPRSIYGRFTGGCAVRWTDLSGVYTQRTCRAKFRPLLGKHFGSKRLAKLELALINVRNGCIASPMATLLPLSRGISLYARFHACVCTGNWCNRAPPAPAPPPHRLLLALYALLLYAATLAYMSD
ncbi:uncharacterized protein LOC111350038 [Spodoptera litura]|uniref:Uncharacterized protein LOC111350038 n=1 Tax=Spodoptera litura TaxID=69820 RepID=A0A9J7DRY0_SPOLT|nr:uncharacterized protein LOC111350038 [Spodoptera litura]